MEMQLQMQLGTTCFAFALACVAACAPAPPQSPQNVNEINWVDGDSGTIDGIGFRLANVDAPETGKPGSRHGAACEAERIRGIEAKAFVERITDRRRVEITKRFGSDRYGRKVVSFSVDGEDLARLATEAGHLVPWPHEGGKPLGKKPDWCLAGKP
jgi:endonuclease YncB( thermonuclease family)